MRDDSKPLPPNYKNRDCYSWSEAVDVFAHVRYWLFIDDKRPDTGVGDIIRHADPRWRKAVQDLRTSGIKIAEDGTIDAREFADLFERLGHPGAIGCYAERPDDDSWPYQYDTRLLKAVRWVIATYSENSEWPTRELVVEKLQGLHGLSKRESEAVDTVTRPDHIRGR